MMIDNVNAMGAAINRHAQSAAKIATISHEGSDINLEREMTQMAIVAPRELEANTVAVRAQDEILGTLLDLKA